MGKLGCFMGMPANHKMIMGLQAKYNLDVSSINAVTAACVEMGKSMGKVALEQIDNSLAGSINPSRQVITLLEKFKKGEDIQRKERKEREFVSWKKEDQEEHRRRELCGTN